MVRLGFIIGFIALIGSLLSGLAAYRVHEQEVTLDGIALARAIDVHASLVQDRLTERELLARVASGLFRAPSVLKANMLQPLRASIYAFKTDFVVANWIARLKPDELEAARAVLKSSGFTNPTIRDFDDQPLDLKAIDKPINVLMDLEPRSADTLGFPGRAYDRHSIIGPMLTQAMEGGKPVASDPIPLLRKDGPVGIVLAAPVYQEGSSEAAGFVTFSYELATLMLTNDDRSLFSVVLKDPSDANDEFVANDQGAVTLQPVKPEGPAPSMVRTVTFGGRDWSLGYYAKTNAAVRAQQTAVIVAAIGLALTGIVCGLFGYVAYNNLRLSREIEVRIGFERRLDGRDRRAQPPGQEHPRGDPVDRDANAAPRRRHRCRARALDRPHPCDVERGDAAEREPVAGRQAEGTVRVARDPACRPHRRQRSGYHGERARRANAVAAVLRTGVAFRRGPVAGRQASAYRREMEGIGRGAGCDFPFPLGGVQHQSAATRREDSDFGLILLDRVAPEALGGTAKRYFTDVSYVYELTAPMDTVVDMTERDRTEQLSAPVRPVR